MNRHRIPVAHGVSESPRFQDDELTVRDQFALAAMAEVLKMYPSAGEVAIADTAYLMADAMMRRRSQ